MVVTITGGDKEIIVSKPGDYEYGSVSLTAHEVQEERYDSKINVLRVKVDEVDLLIVSTGHETSKDIMNNLANINVAIVPYISTEFLKKVVTDYEPHALAILNKFESSEEISI